MVLNQTYQVRTKRNTMLKYLFTAQYKDGTTYEQNEQDVSLADGKRSCFFDVKQDEVEVFHLQGNDNVFSVSMIDGSFAVNGIWFYMHDSALGLKDFRLIFYRQHTHQFNAETRAELAHQIEYCIGWQTNDAIDGYIKRVLTV